MDSEDRYLFKTALSEAFARQFDEDVRLSDQNSSCSVTHLTRIHDIIGTDRTEKRTESRGKSSGWLVLLLAASMILAGCTAYAYRNEIHGLIEKVYERFNRITVSNTDSQEGTIQRHYSLSVVPDGFSLDSEHRSLEGDRIIWKNAEGEYICFEQKYSSKTSIMVDSESGVTQSFLVDEKAVYHRKGTGDTFIWEDNGYLYQIISSFPLDQDTIEQIIRGMKETDNSGT